MSTVKVTDLHECVAAILIKNGVPESDAKIVADSIIYAHTRGKHTHGIARMPIYIRKIKANLMNPLTPLSVIKESPVISVLDAENGFGQVAAIRATDKCIETAKVYGIGLVGVKDSNNFGTAGFIGEHATKAGMIGVVLSNSGPAIAPTGGNKPIFGTNPLCVSYPAAGNYPPIIFDMACSTAARGKIRLAAKNGERIPLGWAIDEDGNETDDPDKALKGTMIPIGNYKGYGLAMCIDILAGMMTKSGFAGKVKNLDHPTDIARYGHMVIAINPQFFMSAEEYQSGMSTLISNIKNSGEKEAIYFPGEKSYITAQKNQIYVDIKQNLLDDLHILAEKSGLKFQL